MNVRPTIIEINGEDVQVIPVTLANGRTVNVRPVPPHIWVPVFAANPEPKRPTKKFTSELGTTSELAVPENDPAWAEYVHALSEYQTKFTRLVQETRWLCAFDGTLDVPEQWQLPVYAKRAGVVVKPEGDERKLQYIRYGLLRTSEDNDKVLLACRYASELTSEEVEAAERLFPGKAQKGEDLEATRPDSQHVSGTD